MTDDFQADAIRFLKPYDRFEEGQTVDVDWGAPIEPHIAATLCQPADDSVPFAEPVEANDASD